MTTKAAPQDTQDSLEESWERDGYVILRRFFSMEQVDAVNALIDRLWSERAELTAPITIDTELETERTRRRLLRDTPAEARRLPYKINDLYLEYGLIRDMALAPELCDVLRRLFHGSPLVCNTLNFEHGSQQTQHIDNFYMPSRKFGGMLASWIALDPVDGDNGPVSYYPGSHRIPPYRFSHGGLRAVDAEMEDCRRYITRELESRGLEPVTFSAEPGDVLIWHSQLLHGGTGIRDAGRTRRSMVTHYFRQQDYRHHLWRIRRHHRNGYYYRRRHPPVPD